MSLPTALTSRRGWISLSIYLSFLSSRQCLSKKADDKESIQIQVLNTGEIWIDSRVVDVRAVRANVERLSAVSPDSGVLILADEQAPTGTVVEVVDQVHLGGIYNITFSTLN